MGPTLQSNDALAEMHHLLRPTPLGHPVHPWCPLLSWPRCLLTNRSGDSGGQPQTRVTLFFCFSVFLCLFMLLCLFSNLLLIDYYLKKKNNNKKVRDLCSLKEAGPVRTRPSCDASLYNARPLLRNYTTLIQLMSIAG